MAMNEVTHVLERLQAGDTLAAEDLLPLVYDELRRLAAANLAREKPGQTLDATALVHEAYMRLVGGGTYDSRGNFFAAAAISMRRILIENARRKARIKHGGELARVELTDLPGTDADERLIALDEALTRLAAEDSQAAQVVELHHFAGLSHELVAETLGISIYQARQKWTYARAWLQNALVER
jgi:RNA polymerase sigma factor (TIGR02999 family)